MRTTTVGLSHVGFPTIRPGATMIRRGLAVALCAATAAAMGAISTPAVGPGTAEANLDGRYLGTLTAAFEGRNGECVRLERLPELVVVGDRAFVEGGTLALRGAVHADGLAMLSGALDGPAMLTGRFDDGRFLGELRGWSCTYQVTLARRS